LSFSSDLFAHRHFKKLRNFLVEETKGVENATEVTRALIESETVPLCKGKTLSAITRHMLEDPSQGSPMLRRHIARLWAPYKELGPSGPELLPNSPVDVSPESMNEAVKMIIMASKNAQHSLSPLFTQIVHTTRLWREKTAWKKNCQ
jgi:hypothetical protein